MAKPMPKPVSFRVIGRIIRVTHDNGESTSWPWPFDQQDTHQDAAWKARYAPNTLTKSEAMELADIADAYRTLVTHPSHSIRTVMGFLHKAWEQWWRS